MVWLTVLVLAAAVNDVDDPASDTLSPEVSR